MNKFTYQVCIYGIANRTKERVTAIIETRAISPRKALQFVASIKENEILWQESPSARRKGEPAIRDDVDIYGYEVMV